MAWTQNSDDIDDEAPLSWEAPPFVWDIFADCPIASLIIERESTLIIDVNTAAAMAFGHDRTDLIGQQLRSLMVDKTIDIPSAAGPGEVARRFFHSTGRVLRFMLVTSVLPDAKDLLSVMLIDPTVTATSTPRDDLTGLSTRESLHPALSRCLVNAEDQAAVFFIDLDNFKHVNDAYGHLMGDEILRSAAHAIRSVVRSVDTVIRFGGDEFVAVLPGIHRISDMQWITSRICSAIRMATAETGHEVTASIGVALAGADMQTFDEVLHFADQAMYEAKAAGGDHAVIEVLL